MTQITLTEPVKKYIQKQISLEVQQYFNGKKKKKTNESYTLPSNLEKMYIRDEVKFYKIEKKHPQKPSYSGKELINNIESNESD